MGFDVVLQAGGAQSAKHAAAVKATCATVSEHAARDGISSKRRIAGG